MQKPTMNFHAQKIKNTSIRGCFMHINFQAQKHHSQFIFFYQIFIQKGIHAHRFRSQKF